MRILLVSATPFELKACQTFLDDEFRKTGPFSYSGTRIQIQLLLSGVGLPISAFSLGHTLAKSSFDFAIQAGVGGAYDPEIALGDVVEVISECFADLGAEEQDGTFLTVHELELIGQDEFPFRQGRLWNMPEVERAFLPKVHGLSVNRVHGSGTSIEATRKRYPFAQVESMEGAAFFYACLVHQLHFLQIRAISNYVEPRRRANWEMDLAIRHLNDTLIDLLTTLETNDH